MEVSGQLHVPTALLSGKNHGTNCWWGWGGGHNRSYLACTRNRTTKPRESSPQPHHRTYQLICSWQTVWYYATLRLSTSTTKCDFLNYSQDNQLHAPATLPPEKEPLFLGTHWIRGLGGSHNPSGRFWEQKILLPLPGLVSQFFGFQPLSHYGIP